MVSGSSHRAAKHAGSGGMSCSAVGSESDRQCSLSGFWTEVAWPALSWVWSAERQLLGYSKSGQFSVVWLMQNQNPLQGFPQEGPGARQVPVRKGRVRPLHCPGPLVPRATDGAACMRPWCPGLHSVGRWRAEGQGAWRMPTQGHLPAGWHVCCSCELSAGSGPVCRHPQACWPLAHVLCRKQQLLHQGPTFLSLSLSQRLSTGLAPG